MAVTSELGQAVEAQLRRSISPAVRHELWSRTDLDRAQWRGFADSGWFTALLPESLDGLGLEPEAIVDLFEAVGKQLVPGPFLEHVLLVPLLVAHGADLPDLEAYGDGRRLLSWWDPAATGGLDATLSLELDDDAARLSGVVDGVRFAADADAFLFVVTVSSPAESSPRSAVTGPAIVLVDRAPSVRADVGEGVTDPLVRAGRVELDRAPIRILLTGDDAGAYLDAARAWSRIATAIELSGTVGWLVDQSTAFAQTRRQFGRPIGGFQALAHLIADMAVHDIALQNLCAAVVDDIRRGSGGPPHPLAAMGVKAYAAEVALDTAESALQAHGGIGFTMEHPLHMYFKHALQLWAWYGDPKRLAIDIARSSLG